MVSRLIQGCGSLCAPDQLLRRENNGSYRFVFVPATFVDDEPETVDVEFPMVATYNDCLLAGKILWYVPNILPPAKHLNLWHPCVSSSQNSKLLIQIDGLLQASMNCNQFANNLAFICINRHVFPFMDPNQVMQKPLVLLRHSFREIYSAIRTAGKLEAAWLNSGGSIPSYEYMLTHSGKETQFAIWCH